ncbi:MAG: TonB-dependent receptor [Planctomycetota bacterium]|nr:MAG: TonB-dependent receptor [Planctomycetota bacterium]
MLRPILVPSLLTLVACLPFFTPLSAEEQAVFDPEDQRPRADQQQAEPLVISPLRRESPAASSISRIDVIDGDEQRRRGNPQRLRDLIDNRPGVYIRTSGSYGGVTSLSLRGTRPRDNAVFQDGLPVRDATSINGATDFASFTSLGIEQTEVLFGAHSGLYGSSAIGGVIHQRTLRPTASHQGRIRAEAGSMDTYTLDSGFTGPIGDQLGYALSLGGVQTVGVSSRYDTTGDRRPGDASGFERDGFRQFISRGRLEWQADPSLLLYAAGEWQAGRTEFDGNDAFWMPDPNDDESETDFRSSRLSAGALADLADDLQLRVDGLWSQQLREQEDSGWYDEFHSDLWHGQAQLTWQIMEALSADLGLEASREVGRFIADPNGSSQDFRGTNHIYAAWTAATIESHGASLRGSLRHDEHQREGGATTYSLHAGYWLWPEILRLSASHGSSFRAPTLFELYANNGNPDLEAETSRNFSAGIDIHPHPWLHLESHYYRTDYRRRIEWGFPTYLNASDDQRVWGLEFRATLSDPDAGWRLSAFVNPQRSDDGNGEDILQTPRLIAGAEGAVTIGSVLLSAQLRHIGKRYDFGFPEPTEVDGFTLLGAAVSWQPQPEWELYLRGENLTNEYYEEVSGYGTPRASVYGGIIWRY